MRDPFSDAAGIDKIINISTGEALMSIELLEAKHLGHGLASMKLASSIGADKKHTPNITTFALQQKKGKQKQGNVKQVKSEEVAVTGAICFTQDLSDEARRDAFSYEWLEYPPSLSEPDKDISVTDEYTMRKGTKSDFYTHCSLQERVSESRVPSKELPIGSGLETIYLIDAMAFIQRFQTLGASTFGQLQE